MESGKKALAAFLNKVLEISEMEVRDIQRMLNYYDLDEVEVLSLPPGSTFIEIGTPLDNVFILLHGNTSIINQTGEGVVYHSNTLDNPQILGLLEASSGLDQYMSGVITTTDSVILKMNYKDFEKVALEDVALIRKTYHFLGRLALYQIEKRDLMTITDPFDVLILYLHGRVKNRKLPYRIRDRRDFLADYLHVSESKLLNYLDLARKRGFLRLMDDMLLIDGSSFELLQDHVATIMN